MSYNLGQIEPDQRTSLYVDPNDEEPPPAPPRRASRIVAALLVMALFAGGLWFAYIEGMRHVGATGDSGDVPLIRADTRPIKVKPDEPGGMHIPDRDMLIYGKSRPVVEHLLPPPEQPMALPATPPPPSPTPAVAAAGAPAAGPPAAGPSLAALPSATPPAAAAAQPAQSDAGSPVNPRPAPGKPGEARSLPAKIGGLRLQLGAVRSEGVARAEWDRIKRTNPDLLGHLTAVAVRADLGDKGVYYRIQAGPVGDAATADRLCSALKQRHLGCIIVR
jgi:SPOR domain